METPVGQAGVNDPKGKSVVSEERNVEEKMDLPAKEAAMVTNLNDLNVNEPPIVSEKSNMNFQNKAAPESAEQVVIDALPVSTVIPQDYDYAKFGAPKVQNYDVYRHEVTKDANALTKYDRQTNWCIEERPRKSGIIDKYYRHLQSNIRCRSLLEVNNFVECGSRSTRKQPDMGDNEDTRSMNQQIPTGNSEEGNINNDANKKVAKKQRGSSLIDHVEVGYYIPRTGAICRRKAAELETGAETPKPTKTGRRRKKGAENATENENKGEDAVSPTPVRIHNVIYDFVPGKVGEKEF